MSLKGLILPGHVPVNKYTLFIIGLPPMVITKLSGLEQELEVAEMPDRTGHSSGQSKSSEMTLEIPMHHIIEMTAMEAWYTESRDPVTPTYKKDGTLAHLSVSMIGLPVVYSVEGVFPKMRKTPEMDMSNETDMAVVEWTLHVDDVSPL